VHYDCFWRWIERIGDVGVAGKIANAQAPDRVPEGCNDRFDRRIVFAALDERLDDIRLFHRVLPFIIPLRTPHGSLRRAARPAYSEMETLQISTVYE
jgi:hypothetical protein